jgi:hypothetical protein
MRYITLITFLFLSLNVKSQSNIQDQIIGSWKVINASVNSKDKNHIAVANSFKNSIFSFKSNKDFIFTTTNKGELMLMMTQQFKNQKWIFEERRQLFKIGTAAGHYTNMGIFAKIENNKAVFRIYESEIDLELVKL